jgi:nucleoside-diphosphate-sugar epimerase
MKALARPEPDAVRFPIQGTGKQTRSFVFLDDFIDGFMLVLAHGVHLGVYNIGTQEEIAISDLAQMVGDIFGKRVNVVPGPAAHGGARRRCPNIDKILALGYRPRVLLREGLQPTSKWYIENSHLAPLKDPLCP